LISAPFYDGLFSVDYFFTEDSNEIILKLDRPLSSVELENEVLLLQVKASKINKMFCCG
jgi:hypothetical protein